MRPVHQPRRTRAFPLGNRGSRKSTLMQVPTHVCIVDGASRDFAVRLRSSRHHAETDRVQKCHKHAKCLMVLKTEKAEAPVFYAGQTSFPFG